MRNRLAVAVLLIVAWVSASLSSATQSASAGPPPVLSYKGFAVDTSAIASVADRDTILDRIRVQLDLVDAVKLNASQRQFFQTIPIVMAASSGSAAYGKGRIVVPMHSSSPLDKDHPVILHELLHAYHDLKVANGFNNAEIQRLYEQARIGQQFPAGSYMLTKVWEYFAMMASVYLHGSAARDPFTRDAVKTKQPEMYQWLVREFGPMPGGVEPALRLSYLGTAGWEISDGRTVVLVDPYLTRAKYRTPTDPVLANDPRPEVTNASIVPIDTATIDAHVTRADAILITHGHPDHTLDVSYIAMKTGAMVIGSQSTFNLERALGVPERQLKVVSGHEALRFNDVTITAIPSRHGISSLPQSLTEAGDPPAFFAAGQTPPFAYGQHAGGDTLAYSVRMGGHEVVIFGSMNFNEAELAGFRPDIALIGAMPERSLITDYTARLLTVLGYPRLVLPTHWDAFNFPYGASQQMAIDRVQPFLAEVKAASPNSLTFVPEFFAPIVIDALPHMSPLVSSPPIIRFYAGDLFLNLHHFLYLLGRSPTGLSETDRREIAAARADQDLGLATLPPAEAQSWRDAVNAYASDLSRRDAISDPQMVVIARVLATVGDRSRPDIPPSDLPAEVSGILRRAVTAYRRAWWPAHHRANLAWMGETRTRLDRDGAGILAWMTRAYELPWPADGVPVHISAYASWAGASSTDGPLRMVSSLRLDASDRGAAALETVIQESLHQWDDAIRARLDEIGRTISKTAPEGLTDAMIWMTAGEAVRHTTPGYVPIANASGSWQRSQNPGLWRALESVWLPHLSTAGTRDEALLALMKLVGKPVGRCP